MIFYISNMNEVYPFCIADTDKWRHDVTIQLIIIYWKSGDLHSTSVHSLQFGRIFQEMLISYKYHYTILSNLNQEFNLFKLMPSLFCDDEE